MKIAEYLKLLFGVWIVFLFLSFSKNQWLMPLICLAFSTAIFFMSYYKYEKKF
jgi:c-di-AMP phosphodiesterase-like protein